MMMQQQKNRSHKIMEAIHMSLPPYEPQEGETDVPSELRLRPGSGHGYVANYDSPEYARSGWWWQETGHVDIDNLPRDVEAVFPDPSDQPKVIPRWNTRSADWRTDTIPSEFTLRGSRGFAHASTRREGDAAIEPPRAYRPTGVHLRPQRLSE